MSSNTGSPFANLLTELLMGMSQHSSQFFPSYLVCSTGFIEKGVGGSKRLVINWNNSIQELNCRCTKGEGVLQPWIPNKTQKKYSRLWKVLLKVTKLAGTLLSPRQGCTRLAGMGLSSHVKASNREHEQPQLEQNAMCTCTQWGYRKSWSVIYPAFWGNSFLWAFMYLKYLFTWSPKNFRLWTISKFNVRTII